ncbi:hypothetical protein [Kitasatospora cinereorecta]|uniref:Uncharacterized protein n=1 Tax=Kitasatospora cinereorecta TaxID=285560 RepID=A0ABW0V3J6_9ACTN
MDELRGSHRVHFVVAAVLCAATLLCLVSTWLPGAFTVPMWLVATLFIGVFPVFATALFRSVVVARLPGRGNGYLLLRYVLLLPPALKVAYGLVLGLAALGFATGAGSAEDAQADASGYFYSHWDSQAQPPHSVRVDLTESEYRRALKGQARIFTAGPAVFYAVSGFLVLVTASAAPSPAGTAAQRSAGTARRGGSQR